MNTARNRCCRRIVCLIQMGVPGAHAETVYYSLDRVLLDDGTQMTGIFAWDYAPGDFENGSGHFLSLDIPWTSHNQDDLDAVFDLGSSIEITLAGSVHDDGVDITLFLSDPLTPTTSSPIDRVRSRYEIGGNGFHDGFFLGGRISPVAVALRIARDSQGFLTISWEPDLPGYVLQETPSLAVPNWTNTADGGTNPSVIPATGPGKFYRLMKP